MKSSKIGRAVFENVFPIVFLINRWVFIIVMIVWPIIGIILTIVAAKENYPYLNVTIALTYLFSIEGSAIVGYFVNEGMFYWWEQANYDSGSTFVNRVSNPVVKTTPKENTNKEADPKSKNPYVAKHQDSVTFITDISEGTLAQRYFYTDEVTGESTSIPAGTHVKIKAYDKGLGKYLIEFDDEGKTKETYIPMNYLR